MGDDPAQRAGVEASPARREEERVVCSGCKRGARLAEVAGEPDCRLLTERHDPLLAALAAADMDELLLEVDVPEIETHSFRATQPGRVHELHERSVPERDRSVPLERLECALDLSGRGSIGQAPCAT